jgi:hypothetical protein
MSYNGKLLRPIVERPDDKLVSRNKQTDFSPLPEGTYFVKKALCLITHHVPSSKELNKINMFLRHACPVGGLHARFEEYVSRVIFRIPLPERQFAKKMRIILPAIQGQFKN